MLPYPDRIPLFDLQEVVTPFTTIFEEPPPSSRGVIESTYLIVLVFSKPNYSRQWALTFVLPREVFLVQLLELQ